MAAWSEYSSLGKSVLLAQFVNSIDDEIKPKSMFEPDMERVHVGFFAAYRSMWYVFFYARNQSKISFPFEQLCALFQLVWWELKSPPTM